jgi:membrane glycosyltransferase
MSRPLDSRTGAAEQMRQRMGIAAVPHVRRGARLFWFFTIAAALTTGATWLFADLLWRNGWSGWSTALVLIFPLLFFLAAFGCTHAIYGFFVLRFGDRGSITARNPYRDVSIGEANTAIILPVYNEEVTRVYEGLRSIYESLARLPDGGKFDFFILSDSTDPDNWVEEERRWLELVHELGALGRIFYRRRTVNTEKKSGNVRDFLNMWGKRYRYTIVLDADSVMRGGTIIDLVKLMEANPTVGLIQTVPGLVNSESAFGRIQQFANRLYSRIFVAGLNYWVQDGGNYWGHNAIIRVEPFMQFCDLPYLPGKKPFGGHILSHDFVEAALMRRADWEVWLAWDLEGSYEEGPQGLIESAQRDRRWCQGNLQHSMLLFASGFRGISRIHLLMGIFGYLASPIWFLFMLVGTMMIASFEETGLSRIDAPRGLTPGLGNLSAAQHGLLIFGLSMTVLFLPKAIAAFDLLLDRERLRGFGGLFRSAVSIVLETLASALMAPVLMLFHSQFVLSILRGAGVNWGTQKRGADGTAWSMAIRTHWAHTLIGLMWGAVAWKLGRAYFWWFVPVLTGMVLSIPLSVFLSRRSWGQWLRNRGLFLTPEEAAPPPEIVQLHARLAAIPDAERELPSGSGLARAVLDPYVNAVHVSLLREKLLNPVYATEVAQILPPRETIRALRERLLAQGPGALSDAEKRLVMSDENSMSWLHRQIWLRPAETLAPWWDEAIRNVART